MLILQTGRENCTVSMLSLNLGCIWRNLRRLRLSGVDAIGLDYEDVVTILMRCLTGNISSSSNIE